MYIKERVTSKNRSKEKMLLQCTNPTADNLNQTEIPQPDCVAAALSFNYDNPADLRHLGALWGRGLAIKARNLERLEMGGLKGSDGDLSGSRDTSLSRSNVNVFDSYGNSFIRASGVGIKGRQSDRYKCENVLVLNKDVIISVNFLSNKNTLVT